MRTRGWSQEVTTMRPLVFSREIAAPDRTSTVRSNVSCSRRSADAVAANTTMRTNERMTLRMTTSTESVRTYPASVALAVLLLAILAATLLRLNGLTPKVAETQGFSAYSALELLKQLLAENVPHPVESEANHVVRDRILARFRELGYAPTIQRARACSRRWGRCA